MVFSEILDQFPSLTGTTLYQCIPDYQEISQPKDSLIKSLAKWRCLPIKCDYGCTLCLGHVTILGRVEFPPDYLKIQSGQCHIPFPQPAKNSDDTRKFVST